MKAIVTGVAGFIGSTLAQKLLSEGYSVTGIDSITDYYSAEIKTRNLLKNVGHPNFNFIDKCILELNWKELYEKHDYVFHLAGQPGVRASWGTTFTVYTKNNIEATQYMLQQAIGADRLKKFVFASTSSIYGDAEQFPTNEKMIPKPVSPYGVTKLAAENLCYLYYRNFNIPTVALRFFTVYGPGQRPDMAFQLIFSALKSDREFTIYGDGKQTRDFTFVEDIVQGNYLAALHGVPGEVYNLGGGTRVSMLDVINQVELITGKKLKLKFGDKQKGDARDTSADISKANNDLGYIPQVKLKEGLERQWEWNQHIE
ncbi:NAD-dependent epimerase/dehydratase family protein [Bacillus sp. 3255]|uniref:NAD-dependent epimerase/dehydratase family protein n=1 Tax=Bacillus sp. 3255 TaxID=2817904 RepID=UPI00285D0BB8|nr:NAD-dependent epimerase/dehydratase family protein [Bacillus sp. 3255]MDR6878741.1 UDP-glucose 4-epimerase [Bacillus sp. 3255]